MTLLTIFTAPKPFEDPHITLIQRNAIRSWTLLGPEVEVILMGKDFGVAEAAAEFETAHLPDVACNEKGVPYIGDMFRLARQTSDPPLLMVINADIILFPDMLRAARSAFQQFDEFVLAGQRWDLDVNEPLDFSAGWEERLRAEIAARGTLHGPKGSDYFLFSRQVYQDVPNFTIGRAGWDNWMIFHGVTQPWKFLDGSPSVTIVHQNHDYRHLPNGQIHYRHPESERNVELGGGSQTMYFLWDIPHVFVDGKMRKKPLTRLRIVRAIERWLQSAADEKSLRGWLFLKVRHYRKRVEKTHKQKLSAKNNA
jgi:hypothetical protein